MTSKYLLFKNKVLIKTWIFLMCSICSQIINGIFAITIRNMKAHVKNHYSPTKSFSVKKRKILKH